MTAQTPATPAIPATMKAVVMRAPGDVVVEEVDTPVSYTHLTLPTIYSV